MPLTDYHTHSYRCGHAIGTMDEYIESAISKGVEEIGLTDHLHLYFDPPESRDPRWAMAEDQFPIHYEEMLALRDRYRGRANVRVSVEADYVQGHEDALRTILESYDFDYILGGIHFMDGWLIDDPEQAHRYLEERIAEIYRRYFANVQRAMRLGVFDVIAHFDLPKKFGHLPEEDLTDLVGETLDVARETDTVLEVSTAGLRKPTGEIYPSPVILGMMRERDIAIVLSSDSHDPADVGYGYDISLELVRQAGYDEVATFDGGVRTLKRIG
jgi:histidinol-phosphatase (PHP family)